MFQRHSSHVIFHPLAYCFSTNSLNVRGLENKSHMFKCNKLLDPEIIDNLEKSDCYGSKKRIQTNILI